VEYNIKKMMKPLTDLFSEKGFRRLKTYAQTFTKIRLPHPVHDKMDKLSSNNDYSNGLHGLTQWRGYAFFDKIYYYYLYHKYNQKCLAVSSTFVHLRLTEPRHNESEIDDNEEILIKICECIINNVDIIIIPLSLKFNGQSHINLLIYRNINKTIEHFEPWGQKGPWPVFNERFRSLISEINSNLRVDGIEVIYIEAQHVCPHLDGLQNIESKAPDSIFIKEEGYCSAWSMFFAELVLMNPTKTSRELMTEIFERFKTMLMPTEVYLREVIRGYVNVVKKIIEDKISILLGQPMPYAKFLDVMDTKNTIPQNKEIYDKFYMWMQDLLKKKKNYLQSNSKYTFLKELQENNPDIYQKFIDFIELSPPDPSLLKIKEWKDVVPQQKSFSEKKYEPREVELKKDKSRELSETDYVMSTEIGGRRNRNRNKTEEQIQKEKKEDELRESSETDNVLSTEISGGGRKTLKNKKKNKTKKGKKIIKNKKNKTKNKKNKTKNKKNKTKNKKNKTKNKKQKE
jgi:hypothetical protein